MLKSKILEGCKLTKRELEILGLVAKGYSNSFIAKKLFISLNTVKTHISNIAIKFGLYNQEGIDIRVVMALFYYYLKQNKN